MPFVENHLLTNYRTNQRDDVSPQEQQSEIWKILLLQRGGQKEARGAL